MVYVIEDISRDVKRDLLENNQSTLRELPEATPAELLAEQQRLLFAQPEEAFEGERVLEMFFLRR